MKNRIATKAGAAVLAGLLTFTLVGCSESAVGQDATTQETQAGAQVDAEDVQVSTVDGVLDTTDLFTTRDLTQTADLSDATYLTVESDGTLSVTDEGTYVLSGTATNATILVDVDSSEKVQLVLDGLSVQNDSDPVIYVASADKVFVTTAQGSENSLAVTGTFAADGDTAADAVVFSHDDLVLNGLGTLTISSTAEGVSSNDDLKITGGTYVINSEQSALKAHDDVLIASGDIRIVSGSDGIHAENDEDDTTGNVYVADGNLQITAADDAIHATAVVQIDGGSLTIEAAEAIEGTYVQVNGGDIDIAASDDGINAAHKSSELSPTIEITGGNLSIAMASGDTDALDSNGSILISGGTVDISAQFAFDFDADAELTGGTVYVNGEQVTTIENSMMMGGGGFGMGGGMGGGPSGRGMGGGPRK